MAKETFGGGTPKTSIENYWNGDFPWIQSSDLKFDKLSVVRPTKFITQEAIDNSATKAVPANSIAIVTRVGVGKLALIPYTYSTSQDFLSLSLLNVDSHFGVYSLYILLQKEEKNIQGTSIKGITKSDLLSKKISIPSDFKEQILIGNFLKKLDVTITLHQRKLDELKNIKQAYIQQIFPEKNHSVPKLRFSNFSNDWKKRVIGDIFIERKQRGAEGELISVTINSGVVKAHELNRKDNSSSNKSNYKRVEVGDIAYNSMRMWQGASGFSKYSGILSPAYTVITPKNDVHSLFFSYYFKNINMIQNFQKYSQGLTSDTWNLKFPSLKEININVPDYSEQKNIANFIVKIDQILLQYENKLSRLEKIKTSLLRKMFI